MNQTTTQQTQQTQQTQAGEVFSVDNFSTIQAIQIGECYRLLDQAAAACIQSGNGALTGCPRIIMSIWFRTLRDMTTKRSRNRKTKSNSKPVPSTQGPMPVSASRSSSVQVDPRFRHHLSDLIGETHLAFTALLEAGCDSHGRIVDPWGGFETSVLAVFRRVLKDQAAKLVISLKSSGGTIVETDQRNWGTRKFHRNHIRTESVLPDNVDLVLDLEDLEETDRTIASMLMQGFRSEDIEMECKCSDRRVSEIRKYLLNY